MLVLSRKTDQRISIGNDISVTVLEIAGNRVKIGITAPETLQIVRGEISAHQSLGPHGEFTQGKGYSAD